MVRNRDDCGHATCNYLFNDPQVYNLQNLYINIYNTYFIIFLSFCVYSAFTFPTESHGFLPARRTQSQSGVRGMKLPAVQLIAVHTPITLHQLMIPGSRVLCSLSVSRTGWRAMECSSQRKITQMARSWGNAPDITRRSSGCSG